MSNTIVISGGTPHKRQILPSDQDKKQEVEIASLEEIAKLQKRAYFFDDILRANWTKDLPGKVKECDKKTQGLIIELKTRFVTNPDLSEHKLKTLIQLSLWHESALKNQAMSTSTSYVLNRFYKFLEIQVYTRSVETQIARRYKAAHALSNGLPESQTTLQIARANIVATADFIRDVDSLLALGFKAPQLTDISNSIHTHSDVQFDEAILGKYRGAVEWALLAFYWCDEKYLKNFRLSQQAVPNVPTVKWDITIPMRSLELDRHTDDTAKDYTLSPYPAETIAALSEYARKVVYDLTRETAPRVTSGIFKFPRKPDWNRITRAQNNELKRLRPHRKSH